MITQALPEVRDLTPDKVRKVGLIFKTHLDLGFTALAESVVQRYMTEFMPRATREALVLADEASGDRFIWTTGSWLVAKYLVHSRGRARRDFEEALGRSLIRWHALPFTFETEALDVPLLESALSVSKRLDAQFGMRTTAAKMTDVPGHTRGIIPVLAEAGVRLLHVGVNPASPTPEVPPLFRWQHTGGAELIVAYDATYGGFCAIPGSKAVFAVAMTGDNAGPPSEASVHDIYRRIRAQFPAAEVWACTMEEMTAAAVAVRKSLPVVTAEIGDSWIHGYGSDPWKMSTFRGLARLRQDWTRDGLLDPGSNQGIAFDENLLLAMEHTWGLDEKTWMNDGKPLSKIRDCYRKEEFQRARRRPSFRRMEASWAEQREYIHRAIASLKSKALKSRAAEVLADAIPKRKLALSGLRPITLRAARLGSGSTALALRADGALRVPGAARAFLGALSYQVFGGAEYERFLQQYVSEEERNGIWAPYDFAKPGTELVLRRGRSWKPRVTGIRASGDNARVVVESAFPEVASREFGAPRRLRTEIKQEGDGVIAFDLQWFDKPASRIAEALWFSFRPPVASDAQWHLRKLGDVVDPRDVVRNGSRSLHIVHAGVTAQDAVMCWQFSSPDAALVAPGEPARLDFHNRVPDPSADGIHFNLFNNTWGTNFPMWYEDDARFRFVVRQEPRG